MTDQFIPQTNAMLRRLYGALYEKNKHSGLYGQPHKSISELSARKTWFLFEFLPILLGCEWNNIVQAREFSSIDSVHEWLLRNCEDIKDLEKTAYTLIVENEYKIAKNIFSYLLLMEYDKLCLCARSLQKEDGAIIDSSKMKGENTEVWAGKALQWAKEYGYIVPDALLHHVNVLAPMQVTKADGAVAAPKKPRYRTTIKAAALLFKVSESTIKNWDKGMGKPDCYPGRMADSHQLEMSARLRITDKARRREARNMERATSTDHIDNYEEGAEFG